MTLNNDIDQVDINPKKLNNVYFKDEAIVKQKISNLINDGAKNLHIISDYDMTLTKFWVNGERNAGSHQVLVRTNVVSEKFRKFERQIFEKYYPYEISQTISFKEKEEKMIEWWELAHQSYINEKLSYDTIKNALEKYNMIYREGSDTLFELANKNNIPLLVFSAGLADIIEHLLRLKGFLKDNVHVVSNKMIFDTKEPHNIIGFEEPLIHVLNKGAVSLKDTDFYEQVKNRTNGILLGDSLGDVYMNGGLDHTTLLKVGFLNYDVDNLLSKYLDKFDVVITNDSSMQWVNTLLRLIN